MPATLDERKQFHLCVDCAIEILDLFESGGTPTTLDGMKGREIHIDRVVDVIALHYHEKISTTKVDAIGETIALCIQEKGLTSCAMWAIAHNLEHILFEM